MEAKHKEDLREVIRLIEFAMDREDTKEIHFSLKKAYKIFYGIWSIYIDLFVESIGKAE